MAEEKDKTTRITVALDEATYHRLHQDAADNRRSLSAQAAHIIAKHYTDAK